MQESPTLERIFTLEAANIKFGPGVSNEIGFEAQRLGIERVMVLTDPTLVKGQQFASSLTA